MITGNRAEAPRLKGKILVLGDMVIPARHFVQAMEPLADGLVVHDWDVGDTDGLVRRNLAVERGGPDAVAPDVGLDSVLKGEEKDITAVVTHFAPVSAGLLSRLPMVRVVATARAGLENIDTKYCQKRGIVVVNNPGRNANAVGEFAVGLMLAHLRGIATAHQEVAAGHWRSFDERSDLVELSGKAIGLVGYGQVGQRVTALLAGFGCKIFVFDPYLERKPDPPVVAVALETLLRAADVVSLHARATSETHHMIGGRELEQMQASAILVNTARAELVDEDALVDALRKNCIGGAALDVFSVEPLPLDHALRSFSQVILTPHLAGSTREAFEQAPRLLARRMRRELLEPAGTAAGRRAKRI